MVVFWGFICCLGVTCLEQHAVKLVSGGPMGHLLQKPQVKNSCWLP